MAQWSEHWLQDREDACSNHDHVRPTKGVKIKSILSIDHLYQDIWTQTPDPEVSSAL